MTADRDAPRKQYVYDDQHVVAVVEQVDGGWRVIKRGRLIGVFKHRDEALAAAMGEREGGR